jgi:hypothetical protein
MLGFRAIRGRTERARPEFAHGLLWEGAGKGRAAKEGDGVSIHLVRAGSLPF